MRNLALISLLGSGLAFANGCPNFEGRYQFDASSCQFQKEEGSPSAYGLPFPVGKMKEGSQFEIVQNGCSDIQINTKGSELKAYNFRLTAINAGMVRADGDEEETDPGNGYSKIYRWRFMLLPEKKLRVITNYEYQDGWPPNMSVSSMKGECKFDKL